MYVVHAYRNLASKREPGDGWFYGPFNSRDEAQSFLDKHGKFFAEYAITMLYDPPTED